MARPEGRKQYLRWTRSLFLLPVTWNSTFKNKTLLLNTLWSFSKLPIAKHLWVNLLKINLALNILYLVFKFTLTLANPPSAVSGKCLVRQMGLAAHPEANKHELCLIKRGNKFLRCRHTHVCIHTPCIHTWNSWLGCPEIKMTTRNLSLHSDWWMFVQILYSPDRKYD